MLKPRVGGGTVSESWGRYSSVLSCTVLQLVTGGAAGRGYRGAETRCEAKLVCAISD